MGAAQLSAWLKANKTEVVLVGGAAVAGLALFQRKKSGAGSASGVTAGAVAPGTIPAAGVVSGPDSSSFDAYNALQDEIGTLAQQNEAAAQTGATGSGVGAAVNPPIASTLYAPQGTGQYVHLANGTGAEVESDGSLFGITFPQWQQIVAQDPNANAKIAQLSSNPAYWSTDKNVTAAAQRAAATT